MKARQIIIVSIILFIIIIIAIFIAASIQKAKQKEQEKIEKTVEAAKILKVKVNVYKNEIKPLTINGFGQVNSSSMINISSEVQGVINSQIALKKGTSFTKDQTLITIRNEDAKLALLARKSNYITLITNILPDLKLDYPNSFNQWQEFYTALEVEKPLPSLPTPKDFKEKNFISSRNIITEYYNIKSDEERLKKYIISAPFSGTILNTMTDEGAVVNPGSPIIAILRDGNLEIEVPVNKNEIDKVKKGANVTLFDEGTLSANGKVARIGNYINAQTQTIPVFIEIAQSSAPLYNGIYLNASIEAEGFETVMEIPRKALIDKTSIFVIENNTLKLLNIDIVSFQKNTVYVKGIPDNTVIVVEPVINGKEGATVEIIKTSNN